MIPEIEKEENDVFDEGQELVLKAYEYWNDKSDDFANQVKAAFTSMDCPSDKVGLFAYAIWQGVKIANFKASGVKDNFKLGDKVELELTCDSSYRTTFNYGKMMGYRNSYLNEDQHTDHYTCSCEKYPNIKFDVIFKKNDKNWAKIMMTNSDAPEDRDKEYLDLRPGDKIKVSAKVKDIIPRYSTVSLNYGKVDEVLEFSKAEE